MSSSTFSARLEGVEPLAKNTRDQVEAFEEAVARMRPSRTASDAIAHDQPSHIGIPVAEYTAMQQRLTEQEEVIEGLASGLHRDAEIARLQAEVERLESELAITISITESEAALYAPDARLAGLLAALQKIADGPRYSQVAGSIARAALSPPEGPA